MIVGIIEEIVAGLNANGDTFNFEHGDNGWDNLFADEENFPAIYLKRPITNEDRVHPFGNIREEYIIVLMFMYKSEIDFTPEQHEEVIAKARNSKNQFLTRLNSHPNIEKINSSRSLTFENMFDVNTSGIITSISVLLLDNQSIC